MSKTIPWMILNVLGFVYIQKKDKTEKVWPENFHKKSFSAFLKVVRLINFKTSISDVGIAEIHFNYYKSLMLS